jgi:hypothetical protein
MKKYNIVCIAGDRIGKKAAQSIESAIEKNFR